MVGVQRHPAPGRAGAYVGGAPTAASKAASALLSYCTIPTKEYYFPEKEYLKPAPQVAVYALVVQQAAVVAGLKAGGAQGCAKR